MRLSVSEVLMRVYRTCFLFFFHLSEVSLALKAPKKQTNKVCKFQKLFYPSYIILGILEIQRLYLCCLKIQLFSFLPL